MASKESIQPKAEVEKITLSTSEKTKPYDSEETNELERVYIQGIRLYLIIAAVCLALFLTNLEIPILRQVWRELHKSLGALGRAPGSLLLIFWATFPIVFRALQGIGGGGNFAVGSILCIELVPTSVYPTLTSAVSLVFCLSLLLGPIFGGAINDSSTWRWIFLLNIPPGVIAIFIILFCLPADFPNHSRQNISKKVSLPKVTKSMLKRIDISGFMLLLIAACTLVAGFEEAGLHFPWRSGYVISLLTISGVTWIVFLIVEKIVTQRENGSVQEPGFSWRFVTSRVWMGMLLNALFLGGAWFSTIFQLPQKFQFVNGIDPLQACVRLMPFTFVAPIGSLISAVVAGKMKIPPIYFVLLAGVLQTVGFALLSSMPAAIDLDNSQYGYEVIAGFGCGINISLLILMTPFSVLKKDQAVAIVTAAMNSFLSSRLNSSELEYTTSELLRAAEIINTLPLDRQEMVRVAFAEGYNLQMKILAGFGGAQVLSTFLMWQKEQIIV